MIDECEALVSIRRDPTSDESQSGGCYQLTADLIAINLQYFLIKNLPFPCHKSKEVHTR